MSERSDKSNDRSRDWHELVDRHLRGELSESEKYRLAEMLDSDPKARSDFVEQVKWDTQLAEVFRNDQNDSVEELYREAVSTAETRNSPRSNLLTRCLLAAAAVVIVALGINQLLMAKTGREIVKIVGVDGVVLWTGKDGMVLVNLAVGDSLPGGTVELLRTDSWIELEFNDGSRVTADGVARFTVSDLNQKKLHLRNGNLSANVSPQPKGRPMLIFTPTAEMRVLGTQLNLNAESDSTKLVVNEGRVRFKRISDGQVVEVPAVHQAVALLDAQLEMEVMTRSTTTNAWRGDLSRDVLYGQGASDLRSLRRRLAKKVRQSELTIEEAKSEYSAAANFGDNDWRLWAAPWLFKDPDSDDKPIVLHLTALSVSRNQPNPVVLEPGCVLRITGKVDVPAEVILGVSTKEIDGGFAAKFLKGNNFENVPLDTGYVFNIEAPLSDFAPYKAPTDESPFGRELVDFWCLTLNGKAKLQITSVELVPARGANGTPSK